MSAGRRGRGSPYPTHAKLDGVGVMLTQQKTGTLDYDEQMEKLTGPEGEGTQRQALLREDFTGGFGVERDDGTPEARRALFYSRVYGSRFRTVTDAGVTALNPNFMTSVTGAFAASDVGKRLEIDGAGAAGGTHVAYIVAISNPTIVQYLPAAVTVPVTGVVARIWTRDEVGGGLDPRFGGLMRGPRVRKGTSMRLLPNFKPSSSDSRPVRKLATYTPASGSYAGVAVHLAAVGPNLIGTTDPLVWDAAPAVVLHSFSDGAGNWFDIADLKVYGSRKGGPELEIALDGWPRHITYDLAKFTPDGGGIIGTDKSQRLVKPQAFYFFDSSAGQFYDLTATLTDDNPDTGAGDMLDSMQATDYFLIGFRHPFDGVQFTLGGHQNGNGATMTVRYWDGDPTNADPDWDTSAFSALADGTFVGVASLARSGDVTWVYDGSTGDWTPAVVTDQYESEPLYFVKVLFSGPLDNNISMTEVHVRYRLQPEAFAVAGTSLVMVQDNALISTPSGGTAGIIYDTTGPFAIPTERGGAFSGTSGEVIGAANLAGTILVVKTDGVFSISEAGETREITPHMSEQPSVETVDNAGTGNDLAAGQNQGMTVWGGALYVAHDWEIIKINADGTGDIVGPERMTFGESQVQLRATAFEGHGLHFLYGAFRGSDGNSYLAAYGVYRHLVNPTTGIEQWTRQDVWAVIGDLGGRTITSMRVMYGTDHQPWLVMGDEFAEVLEASLPRGFHPLAPGSGYEFSDALAEAVFPRYDGFDPSRAIESHRATWRLRHADAGHAIELFAKGGHPDVGAWPALPQSVVSDPDGDGFDDVSLVPAYEGYGLNIRLRFVCPPGDHATPGPILDAFAPWYRQSPLPNQRTWSLNIQAHDRVMTLQQRRIPYTVASWEAFVRGLVGRRVALVTPTGEVRIVSVDGIKETVARPAPQGPPQLAYTVTCSSAE